MKDIFAKIKPRKMIKIKCLLIFIFLPSLIFSQPFNTVKGQITGEGGQMMSANVLALRSADSSLIKGDFFIDGIFELTELQSEEVIIKLSSIEFDDIFLNVAFKENTNIDLGVIEVKNAQIQIDEVVVSGKRPTVIQRSNGTLEVQIENTTLSASTSINEVLSKSPDVLVDEDGNVSVFGKGNAIIYLNNKRITQNQLGLISPSNIKRIEIIRNPSAKYDAEGGSVINIITIGKQEDGYQVRLNQNASYSRFAGVNTHSGLNISIRKGRLNSNANFSLIQGRDRHILHTTRDRASEDVFLKTDLTTDWQHHYKPFTNYGIGLQYELDKKKLCLHRVCRLLRKTWW